MTIITTITVTVTCHLTQVILEEPLYAKRAIGIHLTYDGPAHLIQIMSSLTPGGYARIAKLRT